MSVVSKYIVCLLAFCWLSGIAGSNAQPGRADSLRVFETIDSVFTERVEDNPAAALALSTRQQNIANLLQVDSLKIRAGINHGRGLGILGLLDDQLNQYFTALKLAEQHNLPRYQGLIHYRVGMAYQTIGDYIKSDEHLAKAKEYYRKSHSCIDTVLTNYELGFNCMARAEHKVGIAIIERNLEVAKAQNDSIAITLGLDNLSNIYLDLGQLKKALSYELEILKYPGGFKSNYRRTGFNEHLSELYVELKDWPNARKYLAETYKYATAINSADWLFEYYKLLSKVEEATGNIKGALEAHKLYLNYKDSVYRKEYENKIAAMTTVYDLEKKQAKISLLEKDGQLNAARIKQRTLQRNAVIIGAVLVIGLVFAAFTARMQRRTKDMQVAFSRSLLQSQEAERQRISRELHDSIGQNILFIKNQLSGQAGDKAMVPVMETIANTIDEVRNISKELYPNQLEKYGISKAVESLAEKMQETTGIFVSADLQEVEDKLSKDAKINCYRIIQEGMNNAIKHSQAKALRITGELNDGKVAIVVQDNGKGFDKAVLEQKSLTSYGVLNMEERAKMLGGKFDIESTAQGTKITITIPLANAI